MLGGLPQFSKFNSDETIAQLLGPHQFESLKIGQVGTLNKPVCYTT